MARSSRMLPWPWPRAIALLLAVLLLGSMFPSPTLARTTPGSADAREGLRLLQNRSQVPIQVQWDKHYGIVDFLSPERGGQLAYTPAPNERGDAEKIARGFLQQNRAVFGIADAGQELKLLRIEPDPDLHWAHLRFDQVYKGIPVFARQLVVHLDTQLRPVAVNGEFVPKIDVPTEPLVSRDQAMQIALDNLRSQQLGAAEQLHVSVRALPERTQLMVYVDQQNKPRLAWSVKILTEQPLGEWQFFVHARRPIVIHAFDRLTEAKRRTTYTAGNSTRLPGRKLIDEGEKSRDPVAQAAQDAAGVVYDYYFSKFQRDSIDGKGLPIVSTVHYGSSAEDSENAAWIGELNQMIYGDGGRIFKPLAYGLDVVAHELTHGVTDNTAQLVYEGQSGALNEAYSDIMAVMVDTKNWTLGEQVVNSPPFPTPVLRDMQDPTLGGRYDPNNPLQGIGQPATANDYANLPISREYDNGGVHINSGIPNHGAYLVATALGRDKAERIYYKTLTEILTPSADFTDHANGTIRAAQDLYGDAAANAVRQAFSQIGIDAQGSETLPPPPDTGSNLPDIPAEPQTPNEPLPQGCSDTIANGGFETDDAWAEATAGQFSVIDPELPHSGKRSAWLGGTDKEPLQVIYQEVRLPPNASTIKLNYWQLIHKEFSGLSGLLASDATFSTVLLNTNNDVLGTVNQASSSEGDDAWHELEFDLSQFAGKTVRLAFTAENTRGNVSSFFVDDVAMEVCTAGNSGPAAPKPSADQVFIEGTIQNADTGRGVSGAQVFFMKPGVSATQAAQDDVVTDNEVLTYATTDDNGYYRTSASVPRGQRYGVIILAGGFRPIVADGGANVPANATSTVRIDATLRKGR